MWRWLTLAGISCVVALSAETGLFAGECAGDHREDKKSGVLVTDLAITGTRGLSATALARISGEFVGNCYNEDSEELQERVRAAFQNHGYFAVEVKSLRFKPGDPLGVPKPVVIEVEVAEGPQYRMAEISFVGSHAFSAGKLREGFPIKKGDLMERDKIASGIESLRRVYGTKGYLDYVAVPETQPGSNGILRLTMTITEGPQYHMGKVEMVAGKELAARLWAEWKLAEGAAYDMGYIDKYIETNRNLLPVGFSREQVRVGVNCPEARVDLQVVVDAAEGGPEVKSVPCEKK